MNILKHLTIKNLKLNKKRTIGTIIGIILSVALICAVSTLITSFRQTLIESSVKTSGYYHLSLGEIKESDYDNLKLNRDIEKINKLYNLGSAYFQSRESSTYVIDIFSAKGEDLNNLSYNIIEGRYPKNAKEIILSQELMSEGKYKIGDILTLEIGNRKTEDGYVLNEDDPYLKEDNEFLTNTKTRSYKIVGVSDKRKYHVFYGITTNEKSDKLNAYIALKNPKNYKTSIKEILGVSNYNDIYSNENTKYENFKVNNELLRWEVFAFSDRTISMLYSVAGVVIFIILFTSIFCIRNSFAISTTEKMKMYGMLASVGATKKQIKKSVIFEGMILGLIAIPIGILLGAIAVVILIQIINTLLKDYLFDGTEGIKFAFSFISIIVSSILGLVTIYFSSIFSAKKASKVSPIENLRNSKDVKMTSRKLKTPKIIEKIFKTGGILAYKNLKRSKKKYRTTVISLAVSIFVFISMYAFINEGFKQATIYYTMYDYNVIISNISNYKEEDLSKFKKNTDVNKSYTLYEFNLPIAIKDESIINDFFVSEVENPASLLLMALDDATFKEYAKKLKVNYESIKNKGILCDYSWYYNLKDEKYKMVRRYKYDNEDTINLEYSTNNEEIKKLSIVIGEISNTKPYGLESSYPDGGYLIVNKKYFKELEFTPNMLMIETDDSTNYVEYIKTLDNELFIYNIDEQAKAEKAMVTVISIFLYGFITVITLIGVTNIFNTITSNMELRSKEFAMLKSVGMTKKEFNRMVNLETIFYSTKALLYGIVLGLCGSYAIYLAFSKNRQFPFQLPTTAIIISIVFVFIIVYVIMKYSISKINKQNTIETIRKDNI